MDCEENTRIISSETTDQLLKVHSEELAAVRKLQMVIKELKQIDCNKLLLTDKDQVRKAIVLMKIGEYIYLNDKRDQVLNLGEATPINLNYTERKALRYMLRVNLLKALGVVHNFISKLSKELPEIFSANESLQTQILLLEKQRRANLESLILLQNRKCNFLKAVAELKMGPYLACELEVMLSKARQNQTKINLLRGFFINELLTRTEHNLKAILEVEGYINKAMENENKICN